MTRLDTRNTLWSPVFPVVRVSLIFGPSILPARHTSAVQRYMYSRLRPEAFAPTSVILPGLPPTPSLKKEESEERKAGAKSQKRKSLENERMSLRCLLFTADAATADPICQVLAGLGVEGEHCSEAVSAVEKVTNQPFQIVIIDWDAQPEAGLLLATARERKASARPLTLAIVSDDASVPKALQAGANSILRKPILINQVNDTLTTARDLLRAKQESAAAAAAGASVSSVSASSTTAPASSIEASEKTLRAGEFLQPSGTIPGAHFVTDSEVHHDADSSSEPFDALEELEPVASSVAAPEPVEIKPAPLPPPAPGETRGLQWYLNARAGGAPQVPAQSAPPPQRPAPAKPELLGFDQTPSYSDDQSAAVSDDTAWAPTAPPSALPTPRQDPEHEQKAEAKLFAYISGEKEKTEEKPRRTFKLKGPIVAALALAACAVVAAPQAPWHPQVLALLGHGQRSLHTWLNPQPVTTAPAPESHESFGRAGDEYKLPVTETIPDATTDPSQIHVVPVVDPTKKPNPTVNPDQSGVPDPANTNPSDPAQTPTQSQPDPAAGNPAPPNQTQVQQNSTPDKQSAPQSSPPPTQSSPTITTPAATQPAVEPLHSETIREMAPPPIASQPAPRPSQPHAAAAPANVPSSLKSQMASMTPEASGNKPPEAAMQAIEPVAVTEAAERALLTDQPAIVYPANAKGQQGTVTLQVLIGRDGSVQDAKFVQGALAFARTAIDGVKLWKFKPYSMNGRPVSVQTSMTMSFKP